MEAACAVLRFSVLGWVSLLVTELAIVTDSPSRTQAVPSPRTRRVWKGVQRSRSSRAGMVLRIGCCLSATVAIGNPSPFEGAALRHRAAVYSWDGSQVRCARHPPNG